MLQEPKRRGGPDANAASSKRGCRAMRPRRRAGVLGLAIFASSCATYHPLPLATRASLAPSLDSLDTSLPAAAANVSPRRIDVDRPLDLAAVGLLAVLNDPALQSEWGDMGVAQAGLLQASLLPNPSVSLGFAALLGGPGSAPSYTASLSQDIATLVTYRARVSAAKAHVSEVNASLLWQEWQVAQQARLLALDLYYGNRSIALTRRELDLVSDELTQAQAATAAGNLALAALAPLLAARASADQALVTLDTNQLKQWQSLDALLGLAPHVRFAIAAPDLPPVPPDLDPLVERLPEARPDLVALQLGYRSSEATVRAAILGQFPAFVFGGSWTSDTTQVRSAGPTATFDLPIFNRNQGQIGQSRATRLLLHEQYLARLDSTVGTVRGLAAQERRLSEDLGQARQAAVSADMLARTARTAYAQGNLDQRSLTDYETTALQRGLEVIDLERTIGEDEITLSVELGIGLPTARLAPPDRNIQR
jgi:outer membrane protein TolC